MMNNMLSSKQITLNSFLEKNKDLPKQGTDEWLNSRKGRIGGSEISTILNKNPYQTVKKLITQRVGLSSFKGFYATYWGTVFENSLRDHINEILNCNIIETGSIPHESYSGLAYSPDGISVVNTQLLNNVLIKNDKLICDSIKETEESIILFEFKCPYSRVPTGSVPVYYVDQPKMGMEVINICEMAVFIEAVFKLVQYENIQYNSIYNYDYHKDKIIIETNPIKCGIMILYFKQSNKDDDEETKKLKNSISKLFYTTKHYYKKNTKYIDISSLTNAYQINKILELLASNSNILQTADMQFNYIDNTNKSDAMKKYNDMIFKSSIDKKINKTANELEEDGYTVFGMMSYKLFNLHINPVYKDNSFLTEELKLNVNKVLATITNCQHKTNDDKITYINSFCKELKNK